MMLSGFFFLLIVTGGSIASHSEQPELRNDQHIYSLSSEESGSTSNGSEDDSYDSNSGDDCSYQAVLNHLNLTKNKELYAIARPVKNHKTTTQVYLQMTIYGILDVRETEQTFIPYVWIYMAWNNEHISWHPPNFCDLEKVIVPTEFLWKPDLTIEEMTEKDKAPPSPYLTISWDNLVELRNDLMMVSTCKMQVYKFPFDIQSCNLSFKSAVYSDEEIKFQVINDSSKITEWSRETIQTQYEWLFINMTAEEKTVNNLIYSQSMIVYTIKMRRQSALYIINFILPVLFFFCLDLASFLISDSGGEKLSFKVTVLLAVTVMQLILNEILPSSSDRIPLIALYCIGFFGLMLLSLLETIVVMHLMQKDSAPQDDEGDKDQSLIEDCGDKQEMKKWTPCACVCNVSADETPSDQLLGTKESKQLTEVSSAFEKLSDELSELVLLIKSAKEEGKPGYWTRMTKTINKVFFIFYFTMASLFLVVIFSMWNSAEDK